MGDHNIARHLWDLAVRFPHQMAMYEPVNSGIFSKSTVYRPITYKALSKKADAAIHRLSELGLQSGDRVVLMVPPSLEFFALTFAMMRIELIPVFIDPGMGIKPLGRCLKEAEPKAFIGSPKAHLARILFGWERGRRLLKVQSWGPRLFPGVFPLKLERVQCGQQSYGATKDSTPAAILFTSGSTGSPKGARYTHGNFNAQVQCLKEAYGISPGEVDLCTFPLFALFAPALGMSAVIPQMDFTKPALVDPEKIFQAIETFGVQNMFGSPALLKRLADYGISSDPHLVSLKRVISAGAPVSPGLLGQMQRLLPEHAEVYTPYGATEALPVSSIGSHTILASTAAKTAMGKGVCVGRPMAGLEVKIIPIDDGPIEFWSENLSLPPEEIGEIVVKGPQVTSGYLGRPDADRKSKIKDGSHFFHRMGDLGYFDEAGNLWFCGRKSHRLKSATGEMFTVNCEAIFNQHPKVYRTALVGQGNPGAMKPVLCVETTTALAKEDQAKLSDELRAMAKSNELTRTISEFRFFKTLPTDTRHNAKIFREKLKVEIDRELAH